MAITIPQLPSYGIEKVDCKRHKISRSKDWSWKEFFRDPSKWWDNRNSKASPRHPDFKHKDSGEPLWMDSCANPPWVHGELRSRGFIGNGPLSTAQIDFFVASLRDCTRNKDLARGTSIHRDVVEKRLLRECSDALVTMYATCGELGKAKALLDMHKTKDVITWTALIAGYAREGQGQNALDSFVCMRCEGIHPDAVTYVCTLKACAIIKAVDRGKQIHDEVARQGLLQKNVVLGGALVDMYAKCGAVSEARQVLEGLSSRNVISWNALIAGYAHEGEAEQALNCLEQMQHEGILPNAVTFLCTLKTCATIKAIDRGKRIHDEIARQGLLQNNIVLGCALVDMYAKCGYFSEARQVLEGLPSRDVVSWNALMTGYVQEGEAEQALSLLEEMQHEGILPNVVTYVCALQACAATRAADKGKQVHNEITRQGLLQKNIELGGALVDMYAKCGDVSKARRVLEDLPFRDVVTWNSLIAGYAQEGEAEEALQCLEKMQYEGVLPNAITYVCALNACALIRAADKGEQIHDEITRQGLLQNNVELGGVLVEMYAKCRAISKAQQVFEALPSRTDFCWNALIAGYAQEGQAEQALNCLEHMQHEGILPNATTYVCVLKACASVRSVERGNLIHEEILKQGLLQNNIELGCALVDMYSKCAAFPEAAWVLMKLPSRNVVSWNALIAGFAQEDEAEQALNCLKQMEHDGILPNAVTYVCALKACASIRAADKGKQIHDVIAKKGLLQNNIVLCGALVDMYAKCGNIEEARSVLEELPSQDVVSWNSLIGGYVQEGQAEQALICLDQMQHEGIVPDAVTYIFVLKACAMSRASDRGKQVHDKIARMGLLRNNAELCGALVDMYAKSGDFSEAWRVLKELSSQDVFAWNSLLAGYLQEGKVHEALNFLEQMQQQGVLPNAVTYVCAMKACAAIKAIDRGIQIHDEMVRHGLLQKDNVLGNALVDMYAKCGDVTKARRVLKELSSRDVVSWNALIAGYVQEGKADDALNCLEQMQCEDILPDAFSYASALKACAMTRASEKGNRVHCEIAKQGLQNDLMLGCALVDMYAKCGDVLAARLVLKELPFRDVVSWNALIAGYAQEGEAEQAMNCLEEMHHEGILPNVVTCACVLNVCSHRGMVEEGQALIEKMSTKYDVKPSVECYTCMIDLLGRAGHLEKAVRLIERMPSSDYTAVWNALLGACRNCRDVNVGRWAFEQAVALDKCDESAYVLMANIYASAGMEGKAKNIETMRIKNKAGKPGWSWCNQSSNVHEFPTMDRNHVKNNRIFECILPIMSHERHLLSLHCV